MQIGWRLERTYLAGAGYPESRLEGLDIHWSDPFESSGHAALWADNGIGKSTITSLRFALYLPPYPGLRQGRLRPLTLETRSLRTRVPRRGASYPGSERRVAAARRRHGRQLAERTG